MSRERVTCCLLLLVACSSSGRAPDDRGLGAPCDVALVRPDLVLVESASPFCESRGCVANRLEFRDSLEECLADLEDGGATSDCDGRLPETEHRLREHCTCLCDSFRTDREFCECGDGFECRLIDDSTGTSVCIVAGLDE